MKGEICAGHNHEEHDHIMNIHAVVSSDTGIAGGKSSGCHGAERMTERFKQIHSTQQEQQGLQQ